MKSLPEIISSARGALDRLRNDGLVEPLCFSLSIHGWQFFKFKARPGHPRPGNAGRGFTHPVKLVRSRDPGWAAEERIAPLHLPDEEIMRDYCQPICAGLEWEDWEWSAQFKRPAPGYPKPCDDITIVRGGALNWEEYPASAADCPQVPDTEGNLVFNPSVDERKRLREIRTVEKLCTDRFMQRRLTWEQAKAEADQVLGALAAKYGREEVRLVLRALSREFQK